MAKREGNGKKPVERDMKNVPRRTYSHVSSTESPNIASNHILRCQTNMAQSDFTLGCSSRATGGMDQDSGCDRALLVIMLIVVIVMAFNGIGDIFKM